MRQRAVDEVGEHGLDDGVATVGDIGVGGRFLGVHQWNAKLQLTVLLAPRAAVPGLYLHPDHRRRRRRPAMRTEFDV